jgi:hypothetical protein
MSAYTGIGTGDYSTGAVVDEYWRAMYGDATISFVPPVSDYNFTDNVSQRGISNRTFTWTEVTVRLDDVPELALIDFLMPDSYVIEITPDLGWSNVLAMFGEDEELNLNNPHKTVLGPFSIAGLNLTDNGTSVTAVLTESQFSSALTKGFSKYLWRAVPWADGNPGLGGLPSKFDYISTAKQVNFSIDKIIKETNRPIQSVTGKKSPRVSITTTDGNNPDLFIEETTNTWRVNFSIDRPNIKFVVKATDSGGNVVGTHQVNIEYDSIPQYSGHVWNQIDSFGLFASLDRLPKETSSHFKDRIIDTFVNRGGSHYNGLIKGTNRELGLSRVDNAITIERHKGNNTYSLEPSILIEVTHTRIGVSAPSFIITDEIKEIDKYYHTVTTDKRINAIISIEDSSGTDISNRRYRVTDEVARNEIHLDHDVPGPIFITYSYVEDVFFSDYFYLGGVIDALNRVENGANRLVIKATLSSKLSGSEPSNKLYRAFFILSDVKEQDRIGWSPIKISALSNREFKESFRDKNNLYFNTAYYKYVVELKSTTNIEWGHLVADQDIWDAVEADTYGEDSLELTADVPIAEFTTPVSIPSYKGRSKFDPWEAFRMGYYYNDILIKNVSFAKQLFRSGVGFKKDCRVTIETINLSAEEGVVNQSPVVAISANAVDIDESLASDIIIRY